MFSSYTVLQLLSDSIKTIGEAWFSLSYDSTFLQATSSVFKTLKPLDWAERVVDAYEA